MVKIGVIYLNKNDIANDPFVILKTFKLDTKFSPAVCRKGNIYIFDKRQKSLMW